jgi:hypothetical protein
MIVPSAPDASVDAELRQRSSLTSDLTDVSQGEEGALLGSLAFDLMRMIGATRVKPDEEARQSRRASSGASARCDWPYNASCAQVSAAIQRMKWG